MVTPINPHGTIQTTDPHLPATNEAGSPIAEQERSTGQGNINTVGGWLPADQGILATAGTRTALAVNAPIISLEELLNPPPNDGSSPSKAIKVSASTVLSAVTMDKLIEYFEADSFVVAAKGSAGGVGLLGATLTPFDETKPSGLRPEDTTIFLSVTIPNAKPIVITTKISDITNAEVGIPIKNINKWGGEVILFSNARGKTNDMHGISANAGILLRVHKSAPAINHAKAAFDIPLPSDPLTKIGNDVKKGFSDLFGSDNDFGSMRLGEAEPSILNILESSDYYIGFAWRAEGQLGPGADGYLQRKDIRIDMDGNIITKPKDGEYAGKWVKFNMAEIPDAIFESMIPELD